MKLNEVNSMSTGNAQQHIDTIGDSVVHQEMSPGSSLTGHHHITIGVGNPQEDFDFHAKVRV